MKLIRGALALGTALFMVGCQTLTPEQKAEQEANARLCAQNGMLAEHEGFGYYSCHRMPSDHELQRYLVIESACISSGGTVIANEIGGAFGSPTYTKVSCWNYKDPEPVAASKPTNCRTVFNGRVANTQCF